MGTAEFKLPIGAKRQVTIPKRCLDQLFLKEGGELLLKIVGDHAILLPIVSVPRRDLPEELRKKFESRRGQKDSDIPLSEFLGEIGYKPTESAGIAKPAPPEKKRKASRQASTHKASAARRAPAKAR